MGLGELVNFFSALSNICTSIIYVKNFLDIRFVFLSNSFIVETVTGKQGAGLFGCGGSRYTQAYISGTFVYVCGGELFVK